MATDSELQAILGAIPPTAPVPMSVFGPLMIEVLHAVERQTATIARLQARLAALEARPPSMVYRGVWRTGADGLPGDVCTHQGGLWHCAEATADRPGSPGSGWTLCAKSSRGDRRP